MKGMGFVFKLKKNKISAISLLIYGRNGVCIQAKEKKKICDFSAQLWKEWGLYSS